MELHKAYTVEGVVPMRFRDDATGLDATWILHYRASCAVRPAAEAADISGSLDEEELRRQVQNAIPPAYMLTYPKGMSAHPDETPEQAVQDRAGEQLGVSLLTLDAAPEGFRIEKQWLAEEDIATLEELSNRAEASDPKKVAESMLEQQRLVISAAATANGIPAFRPEKPAGGGLFFQTAKPATNGIRWVCACGSVNDANFCPECGAKKSFRKWICACGNENDSPFCPECGRKFE